MSNAICTPANSPAPDWPDDPFDKALAAEPRLRAVDKMVRTLAANAPTGRSKRPMCAGCIWSGILKPLLKPLVGWERHVQRQAPETRPHGMRVLDMSALRAEAAQERRPPATSSTERWLRGSEAWDAVTSRWLAILDKADPANGCGLSV